MTLKRHDVCTWLLRHGWVETRRASTGHRLFTHEKSGVKVTVPGHGPSDLSKMVAGNIVHLISVAGFGATREIREAVAGRKLLDAAERAVLGAPPGSRWV